MTPDNDLTDPLSASTLSLETGDVLYHQGQPENHIYTIVSGHLKLQHLEASGVASIAAVLGPGEMLGPGLGGDSHASQTVVAKRPTTLHRDTAAGFRAQMMQDGDLLTRVIRMLARRQDMTERRLHAVLTRTVRGRIAVTLSDLVRLAGGRCVHGHEVDVPLTQQELAELVGASRPVVSAELNALRREGLLDYTRGHICMNRLDHWDTLSTD